MKRRTFLQGLFGGAAAATALPLALEPRSTVIEHVGSAKGTWNGPPANLQNLPRAEAPIPSWPFDNDVDTGIYLTEGELAFAVDGKKMARFDQF